MTATLTKLRTFADKTVNALTTELGSHQPIINALVQIPVRDYTMRFMYENPELRPTMLANLELLLPNCIAHETAAVATISAGCAWLDGDLETTRAFLDKALKEDSQYSLARLLDVALTHGVPPRVWAESLKDVSPDQCLTGA